MKDVNYLWIKMLESVVLIWSQLKSVESLLFKCMDNATSDNQIKIPYTSKMNQKWKLIRISSQDPEFRIVLYLADLFIFIWTKSKMRRLTVAMVAVQLCCCIP